MYHLTPKNFLQRGDKKNLISFKDNIKQKLTQKLNENTN